MTELTVFLTLLVIVVACVMMLLPEDTKGDKVAEIQDKKLIDIRNKEISCIIDSIQLLLSECPLHIKYIMDIHDITVEINNKYIYAGSFDMELLNKLLHSWITSRDKADKQLINFTDLDREFKDLKGLLDNGAYNSQLSHR